jgi:hypothetical protein
MFSKQKQRCFYMASAAGGTIMPVVAAAGNAAIGAIRRQLTKSLGEVFNGIFRNGALTTVQKCKQWQNCVVYAAGKVVQRMEQMDAGRLHREMNKA